MTFAVIKQLQTLTLIDCDSSDVLCLGLPHCKSLLRLRIGIPSSHEENCNITDEGVEEIAKLEQL